MNFIEATMKFYMLKLTELNKLTTIPYRTLQNWLYNDREMPEYMELLIMSRLRVLYGEDVHDAFFKWRYEYCCPTPVITWKGYTEEILRYIEKYNSVRF